MQRQMYSQRKGLWLVPGGVLGGRLKKHFQNLCCFQIIAILTVPNVQGQVCRKMVQLMFVASLVLAGSNNNNNKNNGASFQKDGATYVDWQPRACSI